MAGDTVKDAIKARIIRLERTSDSGYLPVVLEQTDDGYYIRVDALHHGERWTDADISACDRTVIVIDV